MRVYWNDIVTHAGTAGRLFVLTVLSALAAAATGCGGDGDGGPLGGPHAGTFRGPSRGFFNGTAQTFVVIDEQGNPTSLGLILSEAALSGLPPTETSIDLQFPPEAAGAPFDFAVLSWRPDGHGPPGVFDKPHFDFHFFLISQVERNAIASSDPNFQQKGLQPPPAASIPPDYMPISAVLPGFGRAWADSTAPEFHGQPFVAPFIYYYYEGRVIQLTPNVSTAFLMTRADFTATVKLPTSVPEPGLYPMTYSVRFDATAGEYIIALESLTTR